MVTDDIFTVWGRGRGGGHVFFAFYAISNICRFFSHFMFSSSFTI